MQVRVIEHRMEQVQAAYSRCVADTEYLATQFLEQGVAASIIPRINDCKTSHMLKKLIDETENMRNLTLDEIDIMLKEADDKFSKEIAVLDESRRAGNPWHPFAWNIVSQKMSAVINSVIGSNTSMSLADPLVSVAKWKDTLADRIQKCKSTIIEGTNAGITELNAHLCDVELIEGVGRQVQSMRLKIKAEVKKNTQEERGL